MFQEHLAYTWHGRLSDGSTDSTSRGRPSNVTSDAPEMADISKYTALYNLALDLSMSHVNAR